MGKVLIGALAGVFVGAMVVEIMKRHNPQLASQIEHKAKNAVDAFTAAYKEGYRGESQTDDAPAVL